MLWPHLISDSHRFGYKLNWYFNHNKLKGQTDGTSFFSPKYWIWLEYNVQKGEEKHRNLKHPFLGIWKSLVTQ